ncbi:hypothetical protein BD324DRAFT_621783 [Kockovaella imperatae]|uniref:Arf-GAP domain-containing protein n=1 Tax=Kockovaella imperatae TaxID=4999 RepID=A0A1Y1UKR4_9TREE|nr:hypothetical protein BD324DRAFT_621783 [Kockovaella imperatae]ORX38648.1 hypothetical protein BD324DRAFT_621783 [Kockovaella imperatae]
MSRQDKATTERNARTLRELVKQPDNKSCADCRKNDARWASWNLGVFLCIRCSGIHRSMGTHISKVKSIDLDMWTPEQMESVQKWGNRRANLYWEKHLKAGHVPPDHKIESFIRSKYESKRWAMDGPPPSDPSVLEDGSPRQHDDSSMAPTPASTAPPPAASKTHPLLSRQTAPAPKATAAPIVDLFGGDDDAAPISTTSKPAIAASNGNAGPSASTTAPNPAPSATAEQPKAPGSSIFDLDFRAPTPSSKPQTNKADIMSLFSSPSTASAPAPQPSFFNPPNPPTAQNPYATWGGGGTSTSTTMQSPTQTALPTANAGWGGLQMDQGAWGQPQQAAPAAPQPASSWGQPVANVNASADPWGSSSNVGASDPWAVSAAPAVSQPTKKQENDPFANLWN